jgi:uncharacterized protein YabE (DUF348 family)
VTLTPFRRALDAARGRVTRRPQQADPTSTATTGTAPGAAARRRVVRLSALATVAAVLVTGSVAVARAHKTVTLDVDGETRQVATFAGSVSGLLEEAGVELATRDVVAPDVDAELRSGDEVVVRHARALTVLSDGEETTVWTTALTADEALATLADRGDDVRLVASRSSGGARADLSLRLRTSGPVEVLVDGRTERVGDGSLGLAEVLDRLGVTLGEHDRVTVTPALGRGALVVVVQRVEVAEETVTSEIPFATVTQASAELYRGQSRTVTEGVPGELTSVHRVVRVDGVEESRRLLDEQVTRAPVDAVVAEGTRARPVATSTGGAAVSVGGGVWDALAQCESGGNPAAVSANGLYYGLFQFSLPTWRAMGGSGLPSEASPGEQLERAQALQARSGWGQWPACARKLGLL